MNIYEKMKNYRNYIAINIDISNEVGKKFSIYYKLIKTKRIVENVGNNNK